MISISLTSTAEYALRAMSQMAINDQESPVKANELARQTGVPLHYLWKIMHKLVTAGLVSSAKGHGGGFHLAKPMERICFLDILEVAGYQSKPEGCVYGWGECRNDVPCPMHHTWSALNDSFVAWARKTTLASVRDQKKNIRKIRGRPKA